MSRFVLTLKESFGVFLQNPKFILPKLVIALLYSIPMLFTFAVTLVVHVLDIFVTSMYPAMVNDVKAGKEISFFGSAKFAFEKLKVTLPAILILELIFMAALVVIAVPLAFFIVTESGFSIIFTFFYLLFVVLFVFLFYQLYPVLVLE